MNLIHIQPHLTPYQFRQLFTPEEKASLHGSTDPILLAFLADLSCAPIVDRSAGWVRVGLERMVAMGIIGEHRRAEILPA